MMKISVMKHKIALLAALFISGCNTAEYPAAFTGPSDQALLQRSKLHTMYTVNIVPFSQRQDIYLREIEDHAGESKAILGSIEEVDDNYSVAIVDRTSTYAIVLTSAKNEEANFFWGPYSKDKWVLQNNEWLWDGFSDIQEMMSHGLQLLE